MTGDEYGEIEEMPEFIAFSATLFKKKSNEMFIATIVFYYRFLPDQGCRGLPTNRIIEELHAFHGSANMQI